MQFVNFKAKTVQDAIMEASIHFGVASDEIEYEVVQNESKGLFGIFNTKEAIIKATKLAEIEDIYRPFKEKKKTRATDAKKKGLDPLAEYLLSFPLEGDVEAEASKYVTNLEGKTDEEIEAMKKEGDQQKKGDNVHNKAHLTKNLKHKFRDK